MDFDAKAKTWDDDPVKIERAQAIADAIRGQVPLAAKMRGFEYGCGTGLVSFALQPYLGRMTLADSSPGMLDVLREKIATAGFHNMDPVKLDLTTDPLPETNFQLIYSAMTFHHIEDTDRILRDLFQLLDSPGYLCIADLDREDGSFHGPDFIGHHGFDREDLTQRAQRAGFGRIRFSTVFHIRKGTGEAARDYPVFLMVAEKS